MGLNERCHGKIVKFVRLSHSRMHATCSCVVTVWRWATRRDWVEKIVCQSMREPSQGIATDFSGSVWGRRVDAANLIPLMREMAIMSVLLLCLAIAAY
ncbi:hypothetical protein BaRGS_00015209 [Batillaria attramentaria]|uniref:Uncharacterized protein n=1 Tax=Batillaria attramentaria TaxID=370345 RepID=A0ABD0L2E5_9CAEN